LAAQVLGLHCSKETAPLPPLLLLLCRLHHLLLLLLLLLQLPSSVLGVLAGRVPTGMFLLLLGMRLMRDAAAAAGNLGLR
jgi:hypothetical protein